MPDSKQAAAAELSLWARDEDDDTPTWRRAAFVIERDGMNRYIVYRWDGQPSGLPFGVSYWTPGEAALAASALIAAAVAP